jgi:hypothetical protein
MTLLATRQSFVELSGRYDLVVDEINWADNGANFFIQAGQRWLDRNSTIYQSRAKYYKTLALGAWYDIIPDCRAIQGVWVSNSLGSKWKLVKRDLGDLLYLTSLKTGTITDPNIPVDTMGGDAIKDPGQISVGSPINYAPIVLRSVPEVSGSITIDHFGPVVYSTSGNHHGFDGIIFLPPVDAEHVLEIDGLFYQPKLVNDSDSNFWTEREEFTLVLAACRAMEVSFRNRQGVSDWESAIASELQGVEFDLVEEESSNIRQLGG